MHLKKISDEKKSLVYYCNSTSIFLVAYPSMSNNGIWIVKGQTDSMPRFKGIFAYFFPCPYSVIIMVHF
jgi:hypothetical protein